MAYREVFVTEMREVLRAWLAGKGLRRVAEQAGVDRKTARRYVEAAVAAGLARDGGEDQLTDELLGAVVAAVRPARPSGHGGAWEMLEGQREQVSEWVGKDLTVVKIGELLARQGVVVPHRTLHRFCAERAGYRGRGARETVRVADGTPGQECQIDFAKMGLLYDPSAGRRRSVHALIFTAVFSRHMFVWLTFTQTLEAVVAGCEAAWRFFGGVFAVLIPDNASAIVAKADATNPQFTVGWLEYAQARGFVTDAARVRSPQDKPRVERTVQYVRGNFFAGETFVDLADAQARAEAWCATTAGLRMHGTIHARPAEVFAEHEAGVLLAAGQEPYEVPIYATVKVHRDYHPLTEQPAAFVQFSDLSRVWSLTGRAGVSAGSGRAGGAPGRPGAGHRRSVGALSAARCRGSGGGAGRGLSAGSAGGQPGAGDGPLLRAGSVAVVPVPVGDRGRLGSGHQDRSPRLLPVAADRRQTDPPALAPPGRRASGGCSAAGWPLGRAAVRGGGARAQRDGAAQLLRVPPR
jgi:hypothetical protein